MGPGPQLVFAIGSSKGGNLGERPWKVGCWMRCGVAGMVVCSGMLDCHQVCEEHCSIKMPSPTCSVLVFILANCWWCCLPGVATKIQGIHYIPSGWWGRRRLSRKPHEWDIGTRIIET